MEFSDVYSDEPVLASSSYLSILIVLCFGGASLLQVPHSKSWRPSNSLLTLMYGTGRSGHSTYPLIIYENSSTKSWCLCPLSCLRRRTTREREDLATPVNVRELKNYSQSAI